jgi:hypothetical protein
MDYSDALDYYLGCVAQLADKAQKRGVKTVLLAPIPRINVPSTSLCPQEWFRPLEVANINCSRLDPYADIIAKLKQFAKRHANVLLYVPDLRLFRASSSTPSVEMWFDDNHLSEHGALVLKDSLWKSLDPGSK